jgi:hypothetical protein
MSSSNVTPGHGARRANVERVKAERREALALHDTWLRRKVLIPLGVGAAASLTAALTFAWTGQDPGVLWLSSMLTNVGAGLVTTMVAVSFVDRAIKRRGEQQWNEVKILVERRIVTVVARGIRSIRTALGIKLDEHFKPQAPPGYIEYCKKHIEPYIEPQVSTLTPAQWQGVVAALEAIDVDIGQLFVAFGARMTPEAYAALIEAQDRIDALGTLNDAFGSMIGSPASDSQLPGLTQAAERSAGATALAAEHLSGLVRAMRELGESVDAASGWLPVTRAPSLEGETRSRTTAGAT